MMRVLLLAAAVSIALVSADGPPKKGKMAMACILVRCAHRIANCMFRPQCKACAGCMDRCEKLELDDYESCAAECYLKLGTVQFSRLANCAAKSGCLKNAAALSNKKSPTHIPSKLHGSFDLHSLSGILFYARGTAPSYSRMDCMYTKATVNPFEQRLDFKVIYPIPETKSARLYDYSMRQVGPPNSPVFHSIFDLFGMKSDEVYHILDMVDGYVLIVTIGKGFGGEYQHAVVYSQHPSNFIPKEIEERFDTALEDAGMYAYLPSFFEFKGVNYDNPICKDFLYGVV